MTIDRDNPDIQALFRQLEAQLDAERADKAIPGLSIAAVHDQDILWAKGFGYADIEAEIPADQGYNIEGSFGLPGENCPLCQSRALFPRVQSHNNAGG